MTYALTYPQIDPVALDLGFFQFRWYALAYIFALILAWIIARFWVGRNPAGKVTKTHIDDVIGYAAIGVIVGGRLGYMLFYNLPEFLAVPQSLFGFNQNWEFAGGISGMSFHGGFLGVVIAVILFAWRQGLNLRELGDLGCVAAPVGIFFGRMANFINAELYGRVTSHWVGMEFPLPDGTTTLPRHPSQLYEAVLEGLVLMIVLNILFARPAIREKAGTISGLFIAGYGVARFIVEFFREPDAHIGFLTFGATMGQLLTIPMIIVGTGVVIWAQRAKPVPVTR